MDFKRLVLIAVLSGVSMSAAAPSSVKAVVPSAGSIPSQFQVALPHFAIGGGWRTQIVIRNSSGSAADVTLYYFGDDGTPLNVSVDGAISDHTATTVPANGARTVEPDGGGATTTAGWAGLVYTNTGLKIQGIFLWHNSADLPGRYSEATAPIISQLGTACIIPLPSGGSTMSMPFDDTEGHVSGYGFANTTNTPVTLNLTFFDQNGLSLGQYSQRFAAFGHDSFTVRAKVPALVNNKGMMQITGQGIVPLGFRFTMFSTFTTWIP